MERTPCARCMWLRRAVLGLLLSCAAGLLLQPTETGDALAAGASPTAPVPYSAGTPPTPAADAIPMDLGKPGGEPGASLAVPNPQLVYRVVWLPPGVTDKIYQPRQMVKGGVPPYNLSVVDGNLPPGLVLTWEGYLVGTPTSTGSYRFTLRVSDAAQVIQAQQCYALRVNVAKAPKPPQEPEQSKQSKTSKANQYITWEEADTIINLGSDPVMYKLTPEKLDKIVSRVSASVPAVPEDVSSDNAGAQKPEEIVAAKLRAVVAPLIDVEYPTRSLFERALDAGRCAYYVAHRAKLAETKGEEVDLTCPPRDPEKKAVANKGKYTPSAVAARDEPRPPPGALTPKEFHSELLPPDIRDALIKAAETPHALVGGPALEAPTGARLRDGKEEACGCVPQGTKEQIYGLYPFWDATEPRQPIDFGMFTRIGYMGVVLQESGEFKDPNGWPDWTRRFTHSARRYGTRVDLVVYRRDWGRLPKSDAAIEEIAERAGDGAVRMAGAPLEHVSAWPFSRESKHAYDGITVFFDPEAESSPDAKKRFQRYFDVFVRRAISEMERSGRSYFLNLVVPAERVGESDKGADGKELSPYSFERLMDYIETRAPQGNKVERAPQGNKGGTCRDETDETTRGDSGKVTVKLLVLVGEPVTQEKKDLRKRIDGMQAPYDGHCRVKFLNSVIPVMFFRDARGGAQPAAPAAQAAAAPDYGKGSQFDKDLAYFQQNYNGVGLWPVPLSVKGDSDQVQQRVRENFEQVLRKQSNPPPEAADALCRIVCPNRGVVRGIFGILVLIGVVSIGAYLLLCRVQRFGAPYFLFLVTGGVATAITGAALLNCDPELGALRAGNVLLYTVVALLLLGCSYLILKPRVQPP